MSEPLPPINVPTAASRFNVPAGSGFARWFAALAADINVQGIEVLNRAARMVSEVAERLPKEANNPKFAAVVTDLSGRITEATRANGKKYIPDAEIDRAAVKELFAEMFEQAGQKLEFVPGDYMQITTDPEGRIAEDAIGLDGRVPAWVLEAWSARMSGYLGPALGVRPARALAAFGDSMTFGLHGGGITWPATCAAALGIPVFNGGISSQTSSEVALRQGGLEVLLTAAGNTIPASGPVTVTVKPLGMWRAGTAWTFPGTLNGVAGVLAKPATEVWTFTRSTAGDAALSPADSRFISATAAPYRDWISAFWTGRNNADQATIVRDTAAMVGSLRPLQRQFLVIGVCNTSNEAAGTGGHTKIVSINAALAATYGTNFVDIRRYLIDNGLAATGIAATAADTTAINEDRIPPSLMVDAIHLTGVGYRIVGQHIAAIINEKGWLT